MNGRVLHLDTEINEIFEKAQDKKYLAGENLANIEDMIVEVNAIEAHFKDLETKAEKYNHQQQVLDMPQTVFEFLDEARTEITLRALMWNSLKKWNEMKQDWVTMQFAKIDPQMIAKEADKYFAIAMRLEKTLDPNPIQEQLKEAVAAFKEAMPIVKALGNNMLQPKHVEEIKDLVKKDFDVHKEDFTLKSLLDLDINAFQEQIVSISN